MYSYIPSVASSYLGTCNCEGYTFIFSLTCTKPFKQFYAVFGVPNPHLACVGIAAQAYSF